MRWMAGALLAVALAPVAFAASPLDAFIRPGALLPLVGCTVGFVFGPEGTREFATAGHCVKEGDRVLVEARPGLALDVGRVRVARDGGPGDDWALVTVDAAFQHAVDPAFPGVGPRGASAGCSLGDAVLHVGRPAGAAAPVLRAGACLGSDAASFRFAGAAARGDSGAPVVDATGAAVGIVTHLALDPGTGRVAVVGTRLDAIPSALATR